MKGRTEPALVRARRSWQGCAAVVRGLAVRKDGVANAWLKDHAGRPDRGVKAADQLARLLREMDAVGMPLDHQDAVLMDMVRGVRSAITPAPISARQPKPAA
jgi:hypothetical protein